MEQKRKGCLGKLAIAAVVCVLLAFLAGYLSMGSFRHAVETRILLEERFGPQESFTPSPDGSVAPDRLEAFCAVRRRLVDTCEDLRTAGDRMQALERFDGVEKIPRGEFVRGAWDTVRGGLGLGPVMGEFFETRNRALLEAGMGLGEYTYIFVIAYNTQLLDHSSEGRIFDNAPVNRRVMGALRSMLARQLEIARSRQASPELQSALEEELAAMDRDPARLPWSGGLPEAAAASIAPRRQELDELFCEAAAQLELERNRRRGPAIETQ